MHLVPRLIASLAVCVVSISSCRHTSYAFQTPSCNFHKATRSRQHATTSYTTFSSSTRIYSQNDGASSRTTNDQSTSPNSISSSIYSHHVAIKTRNIENAISFYSLLGFTVESKFVSGPAKAAWLLHERCLNNNNNNNNSCVKSRIELIEVPSYMLNEPEGMKRRAVDLTKQEELLGLNHFALDVTGCIPRPNNDDGASEDGTACALYQLKEWMDDLNALSLDKFGRTLRVALEPTKRIIGREVYEMAFLYDADGALVELLNHSGRLEQKVGDGWAPWDGKGFVQ
eukprot:scaffold103_cov193-Alexandrium_tamarense.AAC.15